MKYILQYLQKAAHLKMQDLEKNQQLGYDIKDFIKIENIFATNNYKDPYFLFKLFFIAKYYNKNAWSGSLAFTSQDPLIKGLLARVHPGFLNNTLDIEISFHTWSNSYNLVITSRKGTKNDNMKQGLPGRNHEVFIHSTCQANS